MLLCPRCGDVFRAPQRVCPDDGAPLQPAADLDPRLGTVIGNHRLVDLLGKGGMGVVYRAEHLYMGTPAAIKILNERHAADPEAVARLLREARAAATIGHPNIVDVNDFGETADGLCYFVMEHVEGRPLDQLIDEDGPLPLIRAINIVNQIGRGVAAAHDKGIIHRDLKPPNVVVQARSGRRRVIHRTWEAGEPRYDIDTEASYDFVKVLDFGVAKVLDGDSVGHTLAGSVVGTPDYMAPEAARGRSVDHRVDIYSLGVLFYEMLTGALPFEGETSVDVLLAHCSQPVPPLRARNPRAEVTEAAERLILRALAKTPGERHATMDDFLVELQGCYGDDRFVRSLDPPMATAPPLSPRRRSLTEDLKELFAQGGGNEILERALGDEQPILLTRIKRG